VVAVSFVVVEIIVVRCIYYDGIAFLHWLNITVQPTQAPGALPRPSA